jgi:Tol biopolymer transport system component
MTRTGLSLYFGSPRPGGFGNVDIYVSRRERTGDPWGEPQNLGPNINTASIDNCPLVTPDGRFLIFLSNRPGSAGIDLYVAWRKDKRDDLAWTTPVPLAALNSPFDDVPGSVFEDEKSGDLVIYFSSNRPGGPGSYDVYRSRTRGDGTLRPPMLVEELSSPAQDLFPTVRKDGREIFLSSDRDGTLGSLDLWVAIPRHGRRWSTPENLGPVVNTPMIEQRPTLSRNGLSMIYATNREGTHGGLDLFEITRTRQRSRDLSGPDDR